MSASFSVGRAGVGIVDGDTGFFGLLATSEFNSTEADAEMAVRQAGRFSTIGIRLSTNNITTSVTFTLRKSGVDTALAVVFGSTETGLKETLGSVAYANTDTACLRMVAVTVDSGHVCRYEFVSSVFTPDALGTTVTFLEEESFTVDWTSQTKFFPPHGLNNGDVSEADVFLSMQAVGIATAFGVRVSNNTRTSDTTFVTRVNGANGAASVTFAAAETGRKEDLVHTDSLQVGDQFAYGVTTGAGSGSIGCWALGVHFLTTTGVFALCNASSAESVAFNTTTYTPVAGRFKFDTIESRHQVRLPFPCVFTRLSGLASANTIATSPTLVALMKNGSPGTMSLSYAAGETGRKTDSTFTDPTAADTLIDLRYVAPNTSGSIDFRQVTLWATQDFGQTTWLPNYGGGSARPAGMVPSGMTN